MWISRKIITAERQYTAKLELAVAQLNELVHGHDILKLPPFVPQQPSVTEPMMQRGNQLDTLLNRIERYNFDGS
jgi:hypothetical protein